MRKIHSIMAAVAASGLSTPALASDILWLDSQHTSYSGDYGNGASLSFAVAGVNVRATGWSISNNTIYQARLGIWPDGMGVKTSNDNSHTIDNVGGVDFIVLQFDKIVELDMARFNTGWHSMSDTDATIGYDLSNLTFGTLPFSNGAQVSQLSVFDLYSSNASGSGTGNSGDSYRDINPNGYTGNLWLIGASFNNPTEFGRKKSDGFKLDKVTFSQPTPTPHGAVPEPSTWAMLLVGFFGIGGALRSSKRRQLGRSAEQPAGLAAA